MGKAKDKTPLKLPKADEVAAAKPLVEKIARAKQRLANVSLAATPSDPKRRVARKRMKRAQRKLRRTLSYEAQRKKPAAAGAETAAAPAS